MKYLDKTPMFFGPPRKRLTPADVEKLQQEFLAGNLTASVKDNTPQTPFTIPEEDRCPSGRHSTRLTTCFCTEEK